MDRIQRMDDRQFLRNRPLWHSKKPPALGGDGEEIFIMGYDTNPNAYTFDAFSSQGLHQASKGTLTKWRHLDLDQ